MLRNILPYRCAIGGLPQQYNVREKVHIGKILEEGGATEMKTSVSKVAPINLCAITAEVAKDTVHS